MWKHILQIKMILEVIKEKMERWHYWILAIIFVLAFILRIVGIDWGMPYDNMHPDEGLIFERAYECALERNFEVKDYYRPNHVMIKLNTLLYIGIQELYFEPQGKSDFALNYSENFALFTVASRIMVVCFAVGVVALAYFIMLSWGKGQALFVSFLFAVLPSYIEHSHYLTPDIPLLFFLMAVLWAAFRYMKNPTLTWLFWMSFFTALATCEKYPGIFGCVIIAVVVCVTKINKPLQIVQEGLWAILFVLLGILAVSPVLIVDLETVLEVMAGQNKQYHLGADGLNFGETLIYYSKTTAVQLGLILTASSIYGIVRSIKKKTKETIILLGFMVYIFPISMLSVHWERYTLPIYAVGMMFGAIGVFYFLEDMIKVLSNKPKISLAVYFLLILLPMGSLLAGAMAVTGSFLAPDTRILLQDDFAERNITANNTIFDCNTPLDPGGYYGAFCNFEDGDPARYKYAGSPKYVMTSSAQRDLYLEADQEVYGWVANFYRKLDENYDLVFLYEVQNPKSYFLEAQNIWYAAKCVYGYMRGAAVGYEIRLYQLRP